MVRVRRFDRRTAAFLLIPTLALLATGCMSFTYDRTPTAVSSAAPSPTPIPTIASVTPQVEITEEITRAEPEEETPAPTRPISGPTALRMEPSVVSLAVGETRLVQVWLDNVDRLHSIELHVSFEPRYVRIEDADPNATGVQIGAGVMPMATEVTKNEVDNAAGHIVYQVAQAPGNPARGSGMVASFVVRALADGGCPLQFGAVELRDAQGQPLPAPQQTHGLVIVGTGGTVTALTPAPLPTRAPVPATTAPQAQVHHTVQSGENLFRIALRYGTTVDAIVAANQLPDDSSIQVGQVLVIPAGQPSGANTYVIQAGDTLFSIARRHGTTVDELAALNGLVAPYTIEVGQTLIVP
jgi:LysM repeat protein